jgi:uncharacterized protein (DUF885 family)
VKWLLIVATVILGACGGSRQNTGEGSAATFQKFVDDYFAAYYNFNPSTATAVGLHEYDSKIEDLSAARIRSRVSELRALHSRLGELRAAKLGAEDEIDAEILDGQIQAELLDHETVRTWRKNPMTYVGLPGQAVDGLMKRNYAPARERLTSLIERMKGIPALLKAMDENVVEPPREFTELAVRMAKGSLSFFRDTVPNWVKSAAGNDMGAITAFNTENRKVTTAFQMTADYLEKELLAVSSGNYAIGAQTYAKKLAFEELVDTPLPRLLEIGEANLERDYDAFVRTAKLIDASKTPAEVMRALANEHPSEDRLIEFTKSTLESVRQFVVSKNIIPIPSEVRPTVLPTPPYARSGGFASMDTPGPFEKDGSEAFYYVTPPEQDWTRAHKEEHLRLFNRPVMDLITIHEAYPGHFVQFLYVKEFPTKTRKLVFCGTNVEGWAHYTEQMMIEEGFGGGDPKIRLAQLAEALVRDARYVAGIKLHTAGMTVEQASRIFVEKAFLDPANAHEEARRGAYNPTYLYYTLGKLQIYELREDYKRAKGANYSLAGFHREFIRQGGAPLKLIRRILLPGSLSPSGA